MKTISRNKRQLIINGVLAVFTLLILVVSVVAWFSNRQTAEVNSINLTVERAEINIKPLEDRFIFPCATRFDEIDANDSLDVGQFNEYCIVMREYVIEGEGQLLVDVECPEGMMAYIVNDTDSATQDDVIDSYFESINEELDRQGNMELSAALENINDSRGRIGCYKTDANNQINTHIRVLYWMEYDSVVDDIGVEEYVQKTCTAKVTFVS